MTAYDQGDILLVPFPFTDQSTTKQRPAVVLSTRQYNQDHPDIILAAVTSQTGRDSDGVVLDEWQSAGLLKPSAVKPVISTVETSLVRRRLGALTDLDLSAVRSLFQTILGLS